MLSSCSYSSVAAVLVPLLETVPSWNTKGEGERKGLGMHYSCLCLLCCVFQTGEEMLTSLSMNMLTLCFFFFDNKENK